MAKRLSKAERQRKVAQQCLWAIVNAESGEVLMAYASRNLARYNARYNARDYTPGSVVLERVDLRIKGVRA